MACIIFLLGSAGLDLASLQPCELPIMIPILQMRKFKHREANQRLQGTTLNTGGATLCSQVCRDPGLMFSLHPNRDLISSRPGLKSVFCFGSDFFLAWALYCLGHLEEFSHLSSCSWVRCPVLCEGAQAQHPARRARVDK